MQLMSALDLAKNELQNPRIHQLSAAPASPVTGQLYYNTTNNILYWYNGSAWIDAMTSAYGAVTAQTTFAAASTDGILTSVARSDHAHGTPAHNDAAHSAVALSALAVPAADVPWNSKKITGLLDPTGAQDAATKAYVDAMASGLNVKASVRAATTAAITLSAPQTVDGVAVIAGDRVLVKNQASGATNGIYVAAAGAWIRSTDADTSAEVTSGMFTFVTEGTANGDSGWVLTTNNPITLGTTALVFAQFSGAGQIVAGTGMTKTGNTLDVIGTTNRIVANADSIDISAGYVGQASITTLGTIAAGVWAGTNVAVTNGGTGASTAAAARTNLGATTKYSASVGGAASIAVTHSLGTTDVHVMVFVVATGAVVLCDVTVTDANTVTLGFATAPAASSLRCVVVG